MRTLVLALFLAGVLRAGAASAADVYGVSAMQKITPQQAPDASWSAGPVALQCARNEWEAFQVVVRSRTPLAGLSLALTDLRGPRGAVLRAKLAGVY